MTKQIYVISLLRHIDDVAVDTLYLHTYDTLEEYTKVSDKLIKTFENLGLLVNAYGKPDKNYKVFRLYIEIK